MVNRAKVSFRRVVARKATTKGESSESNWTVVAWVYRDEKKLAPPRAITKIEKNAKAEGLSFLRSIFFLAAIHRTKAAERFVVEARLIVARECVFCI